MPKPIKKASKRSGGARSIKVKNKRTQQELGKKIVSKVKSKKARARISNATDIADRIKKRKQDETMIVAQHSKKQVMEDTSHGAHLNMETHHTGKLFGERDIKREIKKIDEETLAAIKKMKRNQAAEEVRRLQGIKDELSSELKKIKKVKRSLRESGKHERIPESHLEWINRREHMIKVQLESINHKISRSSEIHSISTKEGGRPKTITRIKHALGIKRAA